MTNPLRSDMDQLAGANTGTLLPDGPRDGGADDHSLHAPGRRCGRCDELFGPDTPVRRTPRWGLVHDVCPLGHVRTWRADG